MPDRRQSLCDESSPCGRKSVEYGRPNREREGAANMSAYIVTDCKGVLGGWDKGDQRHFMEGAADLWRRITSLRGRLVRRRVLLHLSWSRAHQTEEQMNAGTISFRGGDYRPRPTSQVERDLIFKEYYVSKPPCSRGFEMF